MAIEPQINSQMNSQMNAQMNAQESKPGKNWTENTVGDGRSWLSRLKSRVFGLIVVLVFLGIGALVLNFYSFVFAKTVDGEVIGIERVSQPAAILVGDGDGKRLGGAALSQGQSQQLFSFAIAIRDAKSGEIYTASSEDRQWAVVQKGNCAQAKFFPYQPWILEKWGTYFGARLLKLYDTCPTRQN